jgi:hypothetical protein
MKNPHTLLTTAQSCFSSPEHFQAKCPLYLQFTNYNSNYDSTFKRERRRDRPATDVGSLFHVSKTDIKDELASTEAAAKRAEKVQKRFVLNLCTVFVRG